MEKHILQLANELILLTDEPLSRNFVESAAVEFYTQFGRWVSGTVKDNAHFILNSRWWEPRRSILKSEDAIFQTARKIKGLRKLKGLRNGE